MVDVEQLNNTTPDLSSINFSISQNASSIFNESPNYKGRVNFHNYEETTRLMQVYIRPVLIIGGTVGNLLTFCVMRRGSMKKVSTCFYMAILVLADTGKYLIVVQFFLQRPIFTSKFLDVWSVRRCITEILIMNWMFRPMFTNQPCVNME